MIRIPHQPERRLASADISIGGLEGINAQRIFPLVIADGAVNCRRCDGVGDGEGWGFVVAANIGLRLAANQTN